MKNLKKKIWVIGLFLVVATAVSFHINTEKSCVGSGSLDCPRIHVKVYFIANAR